MEKISLISSSSTLLLVSFWNGLWTGTLAGMTGWYTQMDTGIKVKGIA